MPGTTLVAPGEVGDFAQAVEDLGYDYIAAWEHVLGADVSHHTSWDGPDTLVPIHEPLVLFGFLAGCTRRVGFTAVIGLPQRQTALVAKQAAEVDVLTSGRLRLGVALGWVVPEFRALGVDFSSRGRRVEEQIRLLRALWTQPVVDLRRRLAPGRSPWASVPCRSSGRSRSGSAGTPKRHCVVRPP